MIKKIKEVCNKNKLSNNSDLIQEDERKKKLDDKKLLLRSEILKQIDVDEKQKIILENEFKKTENNQKNFINKNNYIEDQSKFQNKEPKNNIYKRPASSLSIKN